MSRYLCGAALLLACADKQIAPPDSDCEEIGQVRCNLATIRQECQQVGDAFRWVTLEDCRDREPFFGCDGTLRTQVCVSEDPGCVHCPPNTQLCAANEIDIYQCTSSGEIDCDPIDACSIENNEICLGTKGQVECRNSCEVAVESASYVGCEYYAVDLDNANVGAALNAAAQQYAVVVSNTSPSLTAQVTVEQMDDGVASLIRGPLAVGPLQIEVIELPPREIDGSPAGEFNTGTHSALSTNAYRVRSTVPMIAYQFNPLENTGVFSNDASLLIPVSALSGGVSAAQSQYLVLGWPQTIADTDDPANDFGTHLRASLTIVGIEKDTEVSVDLATDIVPLPGYEDYAASGTQLDVALGPFSVLNLETGGFNADFSGTIVSSSLPIAVFSGGEAMDVPYFPGLEQRQCCADHLEEQLAPIHTLGTTYVIVRTPSRTCALDAAGADLRCNEEEYDVIRFVSTGEFPIVETSLPGLDAKLELSSGEPTDVDAYEDFWARGTSAMAVGQFVTSQWAVCGLGNNDQPCGDPAFMLMPPVEQYRRDYLFLVPDKYAFDYLLIAAPVAANVRLNNQPIDDFSYCQRKAIRDPVPLQEGAVEFSTITCALSDPDIDPGPPAIISDGVQRDGVHRLTADQPVGLVVYGFDAFVSYGYAGGTNLRAINVN